MQTKQKKLKSQNSTGNIKVNESAGRGPFLHEINKPSIIFSTGAHDDLLRSSGSPSNGIVSQRICTLSDDIICNAEAISGAQSHNGGAKHLASFKIALNAALLTIGDRSNG